MDLHEALAKLEDAMNGYFSLVLGEDIDHIGVGTEVERLDRLAEFVQSLT